MTDASPATAAATVPCPFCALGCDDLSPHLNGTRLRLSAPDDCPILDAAAAAADAALASPAVPRVGGAPASLEAACAAAAGLLGGARAPLVSGLAADLAGIRAALHLARALGATVDHAHGDALQRNLAVFQGDGWMTASLGEVRNRCDLLVVLGAGLFRRLPRLAGRVLRPAERLDGGAGPALVILDTVAPETLPEVVRALEPELLPVPVARAGEALGWLRALLAGRPVMADGAGGAGRTALAALLARLRAARYPVIAWSAAEFDFPHADLALAQAAGLVRSLNGTGRAALLPLGAGDADASAHQACAWHSGFSLRTAFAGGRAAYDPHLHRGDRLLAAGEADALLWLSCLRPDPAPPESPVPTVAVGHPGLRLAAEPEVFIPVGVPGIDHAGLIHRGDGLATLGLRRLRDNPWPTAAAVLGRILELIPAREEN